MAAADTTTNQALDTSRVVGGSGIYPFVQNLILVAGTKFSARR